MIVDEVNQEPTPAAGSTQWQRVGLLMLTAVVFYGALYMLWPSSRSERFHAGVPLLWLLDFSLYQRHRLPAQRRRFLWVALILSMGAILLVWSALAQTAHSIGARVAPGELVVWIWFLASLAVLYAVLHAILTKLLQVPPASRVALAEPRGWWLRGLRAFIALALFVPYAFTASNIHRFKNANNTNPQQVCHLPYETVNFRAADDNLPLSGWFIPCRGSTATVLICHGVSANKGNFLPLVPFLHRAGFSVFIFDFRGHGDSAGHTVSFGAYEARDVRGAVLYLRGRRDVQRIAAYAFSMGGSCLLHAIDDLPELRGVVVDSTFADMTTIAQSQLPPLPSGLNQPMLRAVDFYTRLELGVPLSSIAPRRHIANVSPRPLLIIHGLNDPLIPPSQAQLNFAAAHRPKELWLVPGASHVAAHAVMGEKYERRVVKFLRQCLGTKVR